MYEFLPGYVVTSCGKVWSKKSNRFLTLGRDKDGYIIVQILSKSYKVHRLVAQGFVQNLTGGAEVNHLNGDKTNNCSYNLQWCTGIENIEHAIKTGLHSSIRRRKKLLCISETFTLSFGSVKEAAVWVCQNAKNNQYITLTGARRNISMACRGVKNKNGYVSKTAYGFTWKYV